MPAESTAQQEKEVLEAARRGDEGAFRSLIEPHRRELHLHCYRMLGSLQDAEDALQDALLKAWRGLARFGGRSSLYTWLYRITTNTCLDAIARRPKRVLPIDYGPPTDPDAGEPELPLDEGTWIEPFPDRALGIDEMADSPEARFEQREAIELAFVAAIHHLSPKERAALVLRDVLGFSASDAAQVLGATVPSVTSALQRARRTLDERLPARSQQATIRALGDERAETLVKEFVDAFECGDVGTILANLAADATFAMPPYASWCRGRERLAASWLMPGGPPPRLRYVETQANSQPAAAVYMRDRDRGAYLPLCLDVLTLRGPWIADVTAFRMPELFRRFGLPDHLADEP